MNKKETFIDEGTSFEGDISANRIVIAGTVCGDLRADTAITIRESGLVSGNIQAPTIYLAEGGRHEGIMSLEKPGEEANWEQVSQSQPQTNGVESDETESVREPATSASTKPKSKLW